MPMDRSVSPIECAKIGLPASPAGGLHFSYRYYLLTVVFIPSLIWFVPAELTCKSRRLGSCCKDGIYSICHRHPHEQASQTKKSQSNCPGSFLFSFCPTLISFSSLKVLVFYSIIRVCL
jgi:hypothetical protein